MEKNYRIGIGYWLLAFLLFIACSSDDVMHMQDECSSFNAIVEEIKITDSSCFESDGIIELVSGADIMARIESGSFTSDRIFNNLMPGSYLVEILHTDGCQYSRSVSVESGVSLSAEVVPIIENTCGLSGCHVAGAESPDLTVKDNIRSASSRMLGLLNSNSMPPEESTGPQLKDEEKQLLICWIEDGAKDN